MQSGVSSSSFSGWVLPRHLRGRKVHVVSSTARAHRFRLVHSAWIWVARMVAMGAPVLKSRVPGPVVFPTGRAKFEVRSTACRQRACIKAVTLIATTDAAGDSRARAASMTVPVRNCSMEMSVFPWVDSGWVLTLHVFRVLAPAASKMVRVWKLNPMKGANQLVVSTLAMVLIVLLETANSNATRRHSSAFRRWRW